MNYDNYNVIFYSDITEYLFQPFCHGTPGIHLNTLLFYNNFSRFEYGLDLDLL